LCAVAAAHFSFAIQAPIPTSVSASWKCPARRRLQISFELDGFALVQKSYVCDEAPRLVLSCMWRAPRIVCSETRSQIVGQSDVSLVWEFDALQSVDVFPALRPPSPCGLRRAALAGSQESAGIGLRAVAAKQRWLVGAVGIEPTTSPV